MPRLSSGYCERGGIIGSVSRADSCDNALAETINGLYKAEKIHRREPWRSFWAVEVATLGWGDWFNNHPLPETLPATSRKPRNSTTRCSRASHIVALIQNETASDQPGGAPSAAASFLSFSASAPSVFAASSCVARYSKSASAWRRSSSYFSNSKSRSAVRISTSLAAVGTAFTFSRSFIASMRPISRSFHRSWTWN
ncbi:IS3 family insertion sequence transposase domain-containing protein (plasmid) [Rhizobium gallicum]|uniref:IS3 family insertion sequence transposase domain-containing protein n=1 Tax=Rhizobium gallicum TaxID=56730 RepID=A0A1L5NWF8_9HYPH|nr:IS3 family insertion sequence transposase domain-containing protein [Rhizobium gallicum]